ncbi:hypothetical protein [Marinobacterium aestuariivivens]|uniref:Uncharacterized protein n=1 Tax=Marinobacterium aestuariivivens TaxID=1698799 RepID=A0ABW2A796_9GAMM
MLAGGGAAEALQDLIGLLCQVGRVVADLQLADPLLPAVVALAMSLPIPSSVRVVATSRISAARRMPWRRMRSRL